MLLTTVVINNDSNNIMNSDIDNDVNVNVDNSKTKQSRVNLRQ